jgi:hypothetical protein
MLLAQLESGEPAHGHLLTHLGRDIRHDV